MAIQIESLTTGQPVRVAPGTYRTGSTPNAHVALDRGATGRVRVAFSETALNPARVLVDLDESSLPNPFAPSTAMVPPAALEAA